MLGFPLPAGSEYTTTGTPAATAGYVSFRILVPLGLNDFVDYVQHAWAAHGWRVRLMEQELAGAELVVDDGARVGSVRASLAMCRGDRTDALISLTRRDPGPPGAGSALQAARPL